MIGVIDLGENKSINVYAIGDKIESEQLDELSVKNIDKIFDKIFSELNKSHLKIKSKAITGSLIIPFSKNAASFNIDEFAEALFAAEKKQDGERNKQITEGNLFIRVIGNNLTLLKLENIEMIDKANHYEMKSNFSTEPNYYKGASFTGSLENILIIDKNPSIAKYWGQRFLKVEPLDTSDQNTSSFIQLIKNDTLFQEKIVSDENYEEIKLATEQYLFTNDFFDKIELFNKLNSKELIKEKNLNEVYSDTAQNLDSNFKISGKSIKENYKKVIKVSDDTKIQTDNFEKLVSRQGIEYRNGKLTLPVDPAFISQLPESLLKND